MKKDVLIVGGGISGLYLSYLLDKKGIDFITVEDKEKIGNKGYRAVSEECYKKMKPDNDIILDYLEYVDIVSVSGYRIRKNVKGYSLKTSDIEKDFLGKISDKSKVLTGIEVKDVDLKRNRIKIGNNVLRYNILILACGATEKSLRNKMGVRNQLMADAHACKLKSKGERETGVVVDNEKAKGLFTWMMPLGEDGMEVGIFSLEKMKDWKSNLFSVNVIKSFKKYEVVEEFHGVTPLSLANKCFGENWLAIGSAGNGQPVVGVPVLQSIEDAEIASEAIEIYLNGTGDLDIYHKIWKKKHNLLLLNLLQRMLMNISPIGIDLLMKTAGFIFPMRWI